MENQAETTPAATVANAAPTKPTLPETISEKMSRLGWEPESKHDANPNALGAKAREAESKQKPAEKRRSPPGEKTPEFSEKEAETPENTARAEKVPPTETVDALAPKREQLKALIVELGMQLEDGRVTSKERAEIRVARKQAQDQLAANERAAVARVEAAMKQLEEREAGLAPKTAKLAEFEAAIASGDHEAIAKIAGFETYDAWQEHVIALKQDPAYKRLRALEQQAAERAKQDEERAANEKRQAEERQQAEQRDQATKAEQEARRVYIADLTGKMSTSADPIVKAMADDPAFVGAVFRVQQENWDGGSTVMRPEDAINTKARGATLSLREELERLHKKLSPLFGGAPAAATQTTKTETTAAAPKRNAAPPPPRTPAASVKKLDDQEWKRQASARLAEAAREEAIERRGKRAI